MERPDMCCDEVWVTILTFQGFFRHDGGGAKHVQLKVTQHVKSMELQRKDFESMTVGIQTQDHLNTVGSITMNYAETRVVSGHIRCTRLNFRYAACILLQSSSHLVATLGSRYRFTYLCARFSPTLNVESNRSWCWQSLLGSLSNYDVNAKENVTQKTNALS